MYLPPAFTVTDADAIDAMLARAPLGCLVTDGPEGLFASHLPMLHERAEGLLAGHLARANPHRGLAGDADALVVFQGASAYVSPNAYPSKAGNPRTVPTWNYEAVQVRGRLSWIDDPAWLRANVAALTDLFEGPQPHPWSLDDAPGDFVERMLANIVGVQIRITRIAAKRKLS
jgi:transcriptional regulator